MRSLKACFPSGNTLRDAAKIPLFGTKRRQQNRSRADQKLIIKVIKGGAAMHLPCSIAHAPGLSQQRQGSVPAFQPLAAQQPSAFKTYHGSDVPTGLLFFSLSQAGHYQDSHPKIYQLSCSGLQTPGCCFKIFLCPPSYRRKMQNVIFPVLGEDLGPVSYYWESFALPFICLLLKGSGYSTAKLFCLLKARGSCLQVQHPLLLNPLLSAD